MLVTELEGVRFIDPVIQCWNDYFTKMGPKDERRVIELLGLSAEGMAMRTPPRELIRIGWQQKWEGMLRARGLADSYDFIRPRVRHRSPLVNYFARGYSFSKVQHLFLASYIFSRESAKGIKVPRRVKEMQDALQRIQKSDPSESTE
jgi:hypothetical protein